jgi:hypothetical protein
VAAVVFLAKNIYFKNANVHGSTIHSSFVAFMNALLRQDDSRILVKRFMVDLISNFKLFFLHFDGLGVDASSHFNSNKTYEIPALIHLAPHIV